MSAPARATRSALVALAVLVAAPLAGCAGDAGDPRAATRSSSASAPSRAADVVPVEPFRDDFDGPASLDGWRVTQGQQHSGGPAEVSVVEGELRVVSAHGSWLDEAESFGLARTITGDVDVIARVWTTGTTGARPGIDWSLAGVMLRDAVSGPAEWVHWTVGEVGGPVLERKRTTAGHSVLELIELPGAGPVDLRLIRVGDRVVLAYRQGPDPWTISYDYVWAGMPSTVELVLTAQSGGEGDHADLIAYTDFVEVVPAGYGDAELDLFARRDAAPLNP